VPEFASLPDDEAKMVQSLASPPLLTVSIAGLLVALPEELLTTTVNCDPLSDAAVPGVV